MFLINSGSDVRQHPKKAGFYENSGLNVRDTTQENLGIYFLGDYKVDAYPAPLWRVIRSCLAEAFPFRPLTGLLVKRFCPIVVQSSPCEISSL